MFATLLMLGILFLLFIPGVFLAFRKHSFNPRFLLKCLLLNVGLFTILGLLFRALPWLVDPRFKL